MSNNKCVAVYFKDEVIESVDIYSVRDIRSKVPVITRKATEFNQNCVVIACEGQESFSLVRNYDGKWLESKTSPDKVTLVRSIKEALLK